MPGCKRRRTGEWLRPPSDEEAVIFIPQAYTPAIIPSHRPGNAQKVLEKFIGAVLVDRIFRGQLKGYFKHVVPNGFDYFLTQEGCLLIFNQITIQN